MRHILFLLLVLSIGRVSAYETWHVLKTDNPPILDGRLDDEAWFINGTREGFVQRDPHPGESSSEQTNIHATYTDNALYVAFFCGDSNADDVVTRLRRRDSSVWPDDNIDLWFDPMGNGLQLYYFSTNPSGVKYDALYKGRAQQNNPQWDGHWNVATGIQDDGWIAEFEIPFSNFKFDYDPEQPWLFNAGRLIRRKGEETYTVEIPYEHNMFFIEDAIRINGIENIASGVGIRIVPYTKSDYRWFPKDDESDDTDFQGNLGLDIDMDIGRSLTLATTVYPDFAEIDLDPDQYQIGFGQVFLPETRPFFLRDLNYFNTINFRPFYSRRIGKRVFDEDGVYHDADIVVGARLTGKNGPVGVGAFYAHTNDALWEPSSDWGIGRITYDLGPNSSIGAVGTLRSADAVTHDGNTDDSFNYASFGVDYEYYFNENWNTWGMLMGTDDSRIDDSDLDRQYGHAAGMAWRRGTFEIWSNYVDYAEDFSTNETGFVPWTDLRTIEGGFSYRFAFGNATFRNLGIETHIQNNRPREGGRGQEQYELNFNTQTNFNWHMHVFGAVGVDNMFYDPGTLDTYSYGGAGFGTDPSKALSASTNFFVGSMPDYTTNSWGTLSHNEIDIGYTPIPELQIYGELDYNKWWIDDGEPVEDYDVTIWTVTGEYLYSRELFFKLFGQGSTQTDLYTLRVLAGWEYRPDSNIYLAYEQWRDDTDGDFDLVNHGIFLKIDHYFQL